MKKRIAVGNHSLLVLVLMAAPVGCGPREPSSTPATVEFAAPREAEHQTVARFVDRASAAGIRFTPRNGEEAGNRAILETLGVGAALWDFDGDGDLDLFFPGGGTLDAEVGVHGRAPALFRNEGAWEFTEVTGSAKLDDDTLYSHGAAAADFDGDGFRDLLVSGYGGLRLYRNQGDGTFIEMAAAAGLARRAWSTSAAWGDVNGDGHLDLFVVNYLDWSPENNPACFSEPGHVRDVCSPTHFEAVKDWLYLSDGEGRFVDASERLSGDGKGLAVLIADVDLDGDVDIYVANDTTPNLLYRNDGRGNFQEVGLVSGTALSESAQADGSMGVDLGDYNLDGRPDIWVANFEDQSFALYRNEGDGVFQHVSGLAGVTSVGAVYVGFGTVFVDFDRDGDEDLFASSGHVMHEARNSPYRQQPLLFENLAGRRFINVAARAGAYMSGVHVGRGVAAGDIDADGDIDLAIAHSNEPVAVLENRSASPGNWLGLRLVGVASNRDAVGALVTIRTEQGDQIRQVKGGASYLSTSDPCLFFGLGASQVVVEIEIRWPAGGVQKMSDVASNRVLRIEEPP